MIPVKTASASTLLQIRLSYNFPMITRTIEKSSWNLLLFSCFFCSLYLLHNRSWKIVTVVQFFFIIDYDANRAKFLVLRHFYASISKIVSFRAKTYMNKINPYSNAITSLYKILPFNLRLYSQRASNITVSVLSLKQWVKFTVFFFIFTTVTFMIKMYIHKITCN